MIKVVGYLRVSGKGQIDGDGRVRQEAAVVAFCERNNLVCVNLFFEAGISGTMDGLDRPAFCELLEYIRANPDIQGFVVERMDRLARDLIVSETLLAECRKRGIRVYCADRELIDVASDCNDPMQKFARQIFAAAAELAKSIDVAKTYAARSRIRASGRRCEGAKPFGFFPRERTLINLVTTFRDTGMGWTAVADMVNVAGHKTRRGTAWEGPSLMRSYERFSRHLVKTPNFWLE
jgi:DNA invertase Pin-like site-specific DNA recombinase